jgi:hypothetical protein
MSTTKTTMQAHARKVLAHQVSQGGAAGTEPETEPETGILTPDPSFAAATPFKVKRRVTVPVLPFPAGSAIVCRILDEIHESQVEDSRYPGAASVCQIEAADGEVRILITGTVLRKALERDYPSAGYVGSWFHIAKLPLRSDKSYADYAITEIEPPGASQAA